MWRTTEIVRDEQVRQVEPVLKILHQVEDLRLHAHVERRHRLVGDDELRIDRECPSDADALALAAGQLVGVPVVLAHLETDCLQQLSDATRRRRLSRSVSPAADRHRDAFHVAGVSALDRPLDPEVFAHVDVNLAVRDRYVDVGRRHAAPRSRRRRRSVVVDRHADPVAGDPETVTSASVATLGSLSGKSWIDSGSRIVWPTVCRGSSERGEGVLEDHLEVLPLLSQRRSVEFREVGPGEHHPAVGRFGEV